MGKKKINTWHGERGTSQRVWWMLRTTGKEVGRRRRAVGRPVRRAACALQPCKDDRRGGRPAPCGLARATGRMAVEERNRVRRNGGGRGRSLPVKREDSTRESPTAQPAPNPRLRPNPPQTNSC